MMVVKTRMAGATCMMVCLNATQLLRHWLLLVWMFQLVSSVSAQHLMNSFTQSVGAGNYSYYKLIKEGNVRLLLTSLEGDADLYVSDTTLFPDFENYELQSTTCGEDIVDVPSTFTRPIGIGVYGHPDYLTSRFLMEVYIEDEGQKSSDPSFTSSHASFQKAGNVHTGKEEEESILWTIFVGILKIIFDILL